MLAELSRRPSRLCSCHFHFLWPSYPPRLSIDLRFAIVQHRTARTPLPREPDRADREPASRERVELAGVPETGDWAAAAARRTSGGQAPWSNPRSAERPAGAAQAEQS